ncbi:MAG: hypothetical protein [Caudoviricetes sp.]|nr:MAG: hypothetical protein [Caudoviricetes sp.]
MKKLIKPAGCSVALIIAIVTSNYSDEIRASKAGLEIIGNAESCAREPYYCPTGVLTDGLGNTHNVYAGKTDEDIAKDWVGNIKTAERCVNRFANGFHLPQSVFDSVTSITFNVGCGNMKTSTMFKYLNAGDYKRACNEFPRWNKAGGKVLQGLVNRREKEKELCLSSALSSLQ